jgi:hypothetical protein
MRNAYELANLADVPSPDSLESPGALFLLRIQETVNDYRNYESVDDMADMVSEIADGAVPIYTYEKWQTFTDLAAWTQAEDVMEFGPITDMDQGATLALYVIAERLASQLVAEVTV